MTKNYLWRGWLITLGLMLGAFTTFAQQAITGKVISGDDQQPIPGVNIVEKGTANGTITDFDGNYSMSVSGPDAILLFSFVGYQDTEQQVGSQTTMNISMATSVEELSEVVVIGYGSAKKEDLTGSVKAISASDFNQGSLNSPQELLNGKVPGVQITNSGGAPGANSTIRIRGDPLFRLPMIL
ncbi:carboxypeptidase-like regulatory domain-containing protein [Persicobacter sp. CCB-QB2]|uniref:carboxypeptidase-like regulatory domain-containing protein n=1 Tax=Persicobacter sp. CCB-QB2 TaxID=1561025 RepID=UPI000A6578BC|nr:carboxypeptidase-like regulatory domain-containing protein [Persicobacter sp. CCB-QB2]